MIYDDEGKVYLTGLEDLYKEKLAEGVDNTLKVILNKNFSEQFFYKQNNEWIETLK